MFHAPRSARNAPLASLERPLRVLEAVYQVRPAVIEDGDIPILRADDGASTRVPPYEARRGLVPCPAEIGEVHVLRRRNGGPRATYCGRVGQAHLAAERLQSTLARNDGRAVQSRRSHHAGQELRVRQL